MKTYNMFLSSKQTLVIDQDDFEKFMENGTDAKLIMLKGGIVNPSFVVCILPRKEKEEPVKEVQGYFDEKRNVFIKTGEITLDSPVRDEFGTKAIAEAKQIMPDNW